MEMWKISVVSFIEIVTKWFNSTFFSFLQQNIKNVKKITNEENKRKKEKKKASAINNV